jgi:hypothetical protein
LGVIRHEHRTSTLALSTRTCCASSDVSCDFGVSMIYGAVFFFLLFSDISRCSMHRTGFCPLICYRTPVTERNPDTVVSVG